MKRYGVNIADVEAVVLPVLRHRIVLTFNAEAEGVTVDSLIGRLVETANRGVPVKAV